MNPFEPQPFQIVSESQQLKAFADPIRNRIIHILGDHEATNQQLAVALGEPQAKVLHHVRFLLDAGLIRLVDQRIKGGNVEKFYRATARIYGIRAEPVAESLIAAPVLEAVLQEVVISETLWPDQRQGWEIRRNRISPERLREFTGRLNLLIAEYWGGPDHPAIPDPGADLFGFASITYRHPGDYDGSDATDDESA
jgi:DNA-binding transcriptional ArsR family regulator